MKFFDKYIKQRANLIAHMAMAWKDQNWMNRITTGVLITLGVTAFSCLSSIGAVSMVPAIMIGGVLGAVITMFTFGVLDSLNTEIENLRSSTENLQSDLVRSEEEVRSAHLKSIEPTVNKMKESNQIAKKFCSQMKQEAEKIDVELERGKELGLKVDQRLNKELKDELVDTQAHIISIDALLAKHRGPQVSPSLHVV